MKNLLENFNNHFSPTAKHFAIASMIAFLVFSWMEHNDRNSVDVFINRWWLFWLTFFSSVHVFRKELLNFWNNIIEKSDFYYKQHLDKRFRPKNLQILTILFLILIALFFILSLSQEPGPSLLINIELAFFGAFLFLFIFIFVKKGQNIWNDARQDKTEINYFFIFLIFAIFTSTQIAGILGSEIGTDEGNALYAAKLIIEGKMRMYINFWTREPGGVLMLLPFLKISGISILSLRIISASINILSLFAIFFGAKKLLGNFYATIAMLAGFLLLNNTFNVYTGIFYKFWLLFSLFIILIYLKLSEKIKREDWLIILLSLIIGWSILTYKAFQIFLVITPAAFFIKYRSNPAAFFRNTWMFLAASFLPVGLLFLYFSLQTDFSHIYKVILGDVLRNYLILSSALLAFTIISKFSIAKKILDFFDFENFYFFVNLVSIICSIAYFFVNSQAAPSFWSGLVLEGGYVLAAFFMFNLLYFRGRKRMVLAAGYFLVIFLATLLGFGDNGFFSSVSREEGFIPISVAVIAALWLSLSGILGSIISKIGLGSKFILISTVFLYIGFFVGGYIMPARILMLLPIYPLFLAFVIKIMAESKIKNSQLAIFITINLFFLFYTNYLFLSRNTSYILYPRSEVAAAIEFIETNSNRNDLVFSADTAILSQLDRDNIAFFTSPWYFRDTDVPSFSYPGIEKYSSELAPSKEELSRRIEIKKPKFIFGNERLTFKTFFESGTDKSNLPLEKLLQDRYRIVYQSENIKIYRLE